VTLDETLLEVFRQALVDDAPSVELNGEKFKVLTTSRNKLRQVDFRFDGRKLRGLEQNPNTASRWAQIARKGKPVMQFLENQRYFAVVADGKITWYGKHEQKNAD
jgi:hypothetical protein